MKNIFLRKSENEQNNFQNISKPRRVISHNILYLRGSTLIEYIRYTSSFKKNTFNYKSYHEY